MEFSLFKRKIGYAAVILNSFCSTGKPTEEQVKEATQAVGLPVTSENSSGDPIRLAVMIKAYKPKWPVPIDEVIGNAWRWHENERPRVAA